MRPGCRYGSRRDIILTDTSLLSVKDAFRGLTDDLQRERQIDLPNCFYSELSHHRLLYQADCALCLAVGEK